ncbi:Anthranilate synthase component 1, partial [Bienertia sinuspersici]
MKELAAPTLCSNLLCVTYADDETKSEIKHALQLHAAYLGTKLTCLHLIPLSFRYSQAQNNINLNMVDMSLEENVKSMASDTVLFQQETRSGLKNLENQ